MEFKHFSHVHGLTIYHMAEGSETVCSGCNLGGLTTVYMCWQCQFFLHEQCFKAKRSISHHPSHPSHPLSFFPSPTHPSASFLCNSCHHSGTGFSYACADCDFDLHVHCAYNTLSITSDHHLYRQQSLNHPFPGIQFENPNYNNTQFTYPPPISDPYPPQPVDSYPPHVLNNNPPFLDSYPPLVLDSYPHVSVRPYASENNPPVQDYYPQVSHPQPVRPYASENNHNPQVQDAYPQVSHPPPVRQYASENNNPPIASYPQTPSNIPASSASSTPIQVSHPPPVRQYASENNNQPIASYPQTPSKFPASSASSTPPVQDSYPQVSHPPPVRQYVSENSNPPIASYPQTPSNIPASSASSTPIPANYQPKPVSSSSTDQNQAQKTHVAKHFSHQHALRQLKIHEEEGLLCSGCEQALSGEAYTCTKTKLCEFKLHKSCFDLPKETQHKSHKAHPLTLLSTPPSKSFYIPEFTCNACLKTGNSFLYHCSTCNFNLHVNCAFLAESVKRTDHQHPLSLHYSSPYKKSNDCEDDVVFMCNVCEDSVDPKCWVYYCKECDFGTELGCVNDEVEKGGGEEGKGEESDEVTLAEKMIEMQNSYQRMQIQMQLSQQNAQFVSHIAQSFSNLAG
ncbi:uncharacterized protein LOC124945539 [Impatiens glandulifera]|uniref:uncharacterized protein LOC124945539 n=1 Tax=Impatiens glandulifera TaxID=253017 RepID=UPI001FB05161|nr:uncharacterized protein LOC124945539 [Impatiens glandulifera]